MRVPRSWVGFLGTLVLSVQPAPGSAQAGGRHLVAGDASGNFVIVWSSYDQDGDGYGIFLRLARQGASLGYACRLPATSQSPTPAA
jgi:hypothetical protein